MKRLFSEEWVELRVTWGSFTQTLAAVRGCYCLQVQRSKEQKQHSFLQSRESWTIEEEPTERSHSPEDSATARECSAGPEVGGWGSLLPSQAFLPPSLISFQRVLLAKPTRKPACLQEPQDAASRGQPSGHRARPEWWEIGLGMKRGIKQKITSISVACPESHFRHLAHGPQLPKSQNKP